MFYLLFLYYAHSGILILLLGVLIWILAIPYTSQLAASMISPHEVVVSFFNGLMTYRTGMVFLNLVPYIALKIMDRTQADVKK